MTDERNKPAPAISPELVERIKQAQQNKGPLFDRIIEDEHDDGSPAFGWGVEVTLRAILAELEPVDPLEAEALAIVLADETTRTKRQEQAIRDGKAGHSKKAIALAALKRGMELAKEQGA